MIMSSLYEFFFYANQTHFKFKDFAGVRSHFDREPQGNVISVDREHICELTIEGSRQLR